MLRTLQLRGFVEPVRRGITQPLIVRARGDQGTEETVFLKTNAGYGDRPQAAGVELFTTLIARRMGLLAPEPVVVDGPQVLAFDGVVQHTDRFPANPNLMWKAHEIAILDHEKVFGYLRMPGAETKAWRVFFQSAPLAGHVLRSIGKRLLDKDFGKEVWECVVQLEVDGGLDECQRAAEAAFPTAGVDLTLIRGYLSQVAANTEEFFDSLKAEINR